MAGAPVGIVGSFAANRPYLSIGVLVIGLVALAVIGARAAPQNAALIADFAIATTLVIAAPMALAALVPDRGPLRYVSATALIAVLGAVAALDPSAAPFGIAISRVAIIAALILFLFFWALAPHAQNVARLGLLAPFASTLGATGTAGYFAAEAMLPTVEAAIALALAVSLGVGAGVNVAAHFAKRFAAGADQRIAAVAGGHGAVAFSAYSLILVAAFFVVYSDALNFGAIDWPVVLGGVTAAAVAMATALVSVAGGLSLSTVSEQVAADENRRAQWFARIWRPVRLALPTSTAAGATAIVGILTVIAGFEVGVVDPMRLAVFVVLVWVAAAIAFVSVRTATLVAVLLLFSSILAEYALSVLSAPRPDPTERFAGLTLAAAALGAMTESWRDAGEAWRNARDVVQHALSDGLRRYLFIVGVGAAALFASGQVFDWAGALAVAIYFLATTLFALLAAPAMMTALSAQFRH
ncbi:MAG: hypothetical protein AAFW81_11950 [Pseudomonadota bacterium]